MSYCADYNSFDRKVKCSSKWKKLSLSSGHNIKHKFLKMAQIKASINLKRISYFQLFTALIKKTKPWAIGRHLGVKKAGPFTFYFPSDSDLLKYLSTLPERKYFKNKY